MDTGNIYKNKAGTFSYCWFRDKTSLATGSIALDSAKGSGVYYNSSMLTNLTIDKDGSIFKGAQEINALGVRPVSAAKAYPGDDLMLSFRITYKGPGKIPTEEAGGTTDKSYPASAKCTMAEKYYVAVYDKKMLWRANLYIAESSNDWNDQHPWTGTEGFGTNDWNQPETGKTSGGQVISLPEFTWSGYPNTTTSTLDGCGKIPRDSFTGTRVSYDDWGVDTPFQFKQKLLDQKTCMASVYASNGDDKDENNNGSWSNTYAPNSESSDYHNYVKVVDKPKKNQEDFPKRITSTVQQSLNAYPYIPGFSFWYDTRNGGDNWDVTYTAAGLDCVAFVHRALEGNKDLYASGLKYPPKEILYNTAMTDRNCHFGVFAVLGQNSVFSPNYDCFRTPHN